MPHCTDSLLLTHDSLFHAVANTAQHAEHTAPTGFHALHEHLITGFCQVQHVPWWNWNFAVLTAFILAGGLLFVWGDLRKWLIRNLMGCAVIIFVAGFMLYVVGFNHEGCTQNTTALALRAATASMEMFVSESELIEVEEAMKMNVPYMVAFAITHFLAVCVSAAFVLRILGTRLASAIRMGLINKLYLRNKKVFVFFDLSDEAITLATSIHAKLGKPRKGNYRIIFVRTPQNASHLERFSFGHLLSMADSRNDQLEQLNAIGAFITYSRRNVTMVAGEKKWAEALGIGNLCRYIDRRAKELHVFCLSNDEEANINAALALHNYIIASEQRPKDLEEQDVHVYCHAHRNPLTAAFAKPNLHILNSATMAALELKENVQFQPVSYVNPDPATAGATKPFRALIVGLGATGTEVLKFLYEFGQFVRPDGSDNPFECYIVDPLANRRREELFLQCPALVNVKGLHFLNGRIDEHRQTVERLMAGEVDYVAVCTESDEQNIQIGITLIQTAFKLRPNDRKLGIHVSVYDEYINDKVAKLLPDYTNIFDNDDKYVGKYYDFHLYAFCNKEKMFTYENIICNKHLQEAKRFVHSYNKVAGWLGSDELEDNEENYEKVWKKRIEDSEAPNQFKKNDPRTEKQQKSEIYNEALWKKEVLMQNEFQDLSNAWHAKTKLELLKGFGTDKAIECLNNVMQGIFCLGNGVKDSYPILLSHIKNFEEAKGVPEGTYAIPLKNVARTEHLRWVASNIMLGYTPVETDKGLNDLEKGERKNYIRRTHWCLVPNSVLEDEENTNLRDTIRYDFNTIWVSLLLDKQPKH